MSAAIKKLKTAIENAEAILVGAGSGFSAAAGYTYSGERFQRHFADFIEKYHLRDMYSAGFYPFPTPEEKWAYWSRHIYCNRYDQPESHVHKTLLQLLQDKDYFVLTTNVDHLFQNNGFDKQRLFYTQGDYGLWQCKTPCHQQTYDNEEAVRRMIKEQQDMKIPTELVPHCPLCGEEMEMNLRVDASFVEDDSWHAAAARYHDFLNRHQISSILYLELGVGMNTPGIIKFPFWKMTAANPQATYACLNKGEACSPSEIKGQSILIDDDIASVLHELIR